MKIWKVAAVSAVIAAGSLFGSPTIAANTLIFTLNNPIQTVTTDGGTVTFNGTLLAPETNVGNEYLNGDQVNYYGIISSFNDDDFFSNTPLFLAPGETFTGDLFKVTIPASGLGAIGSGTYSIIGGISPDDQDILGSQSFSITVFAANSAVPEPAAWTMMIGGFGLVGATMRRKKVAVSFA